MKSSLLNMVVVLTIITALVGGILGSVYKITKEPISAATAKAQEEAIREVAPAFDNTPAEECYEVEVYGMTATVFPAKQGGVLTGAAVKAGSMNGFGGEISVMVGFELDGTIRNYRVLSHAETPGLGAKMDDWFRTDKNRQSVLGKNPATSNLTVSKDGGDVDAITASTISSRAFLESLRTAYAAFKDNNIDVTSGSTVKTDTTADAVSDPIVVTVNQEEAI